MDKKAFLMNLMNEFEDWWNEDQHKSNMDYYKNIITASHLASLSDHDFLAFIFKFVSEGGKVQSGGHRSINTFRSMVGNNVNSFKMFMLTPFQVDFSLKEWFLKLDKFPGFGVGIATIFLNRIDANKFPIMNNKTLKALNKLGCRISPSKNWRNYELVRKYQNDLINEFPTLHDFYKADALNHFIEAESRGKELISGHLQIVQFEDGLEQQQLEGDVEASLFGKDKNDLLLKIIECENDKSEIISINGKKYKRYNYLMAQIKKYRDYRCQFCSTMILKANGSYYVEACHIKPKAEGGRDRLNNILVLCPNCHKLFDHGHKEKEEYVGEAYSVVLNEKTYKASLK